jgi:hypothetical protein
MLETVSIPITDAAYVLIGSAVTNLTCKTFGGLSDRAQNAASREYNIIVKEPGGAAPTSADPGMGVKGDFVLTGVSADVYAMSHRGDVVMEVIRS